jgi:hypothetical protein
MKFTVVTTALADDQLARLWLQAADRQRITEAYDRIESLLKHDAHLAGALHPGGWRVIYEPPIVASFRVREDDRLVKDLSVALRS